MNPFGLYKFEGITDFGIFKKGKIYLYYRKTPFYRDIQDNNKYWKHWFKDRLTGESTFVFGGGFEKGSFILVEELPLK